MHSQAPPPPRLLFVRVSRTGAGLVPVGPVSPVSTLIGSVEGGTN